MDIFAFPLQFDSDGIRKLKNGTDNYYSQLLTLAILTEPETHPLTPDFGTIDPTFKTVERGRFLIQAARFVPEITLTNIEIDLQAEDKSLIKFSFRKR